MKTFKFTQGYDRWNRWATCVLILDRSGDIFPFSGRGIHRVLQIVGVRNSPTKTVYTCEVPEGVTPVIWKDKGKLGTDWPQASWEAGLAWLQEQAPGAQLTMRNFKFFIRAYIGDAAERWDKASGED